MSFFHMVVWKAAQTHYCSKTLLKQSERNSERPHRVQLIYPSIFVDRFLVYIARPLSVWTSCSKSCSRAVMLLNSVSNDQQTRPMHSTSDATWARPLLNTRALGRSLIAAMTRQVGYSSQCTKNEIFSLRTNIESHTPLHPSSTANWLKGGEWSKKQQQTKHLDGR